MNTKRSKHAAPNRNETAAVGVENYRSMAESTSSDEEPRADRFSRHDAAWRHPAQITSQWADASEVDPKLFECTVQGAWWDVMSDCGGTLLVTREYEHLVVALRYSSRDSAASFMPMPHPSGLCVDHGRRIVHLASTRNPNQIYDLMPVTGTIERQDVEAVEIEGRPLVPVRSRFLPGSLYLHDLAIIDGSLYAASSGQNAIVRIHDRGGHEIAWWPKCIEHEEGPAFGQNYIQLNSIAPGESLESSYFTASSAEISSRRPGQPDYPVDGRGVVFSGASREPVARGLTRPHSARLHNGGLWLTNSGYGQLCIIGDGESSAICRLPGWTRGLCFYEDIAFVGTSRLIPRFRQYAPGLDVDASQCGIHAVDIRTGKTLGSLLWPNGNQIFALELVPRDVCTGFPYSAMSKTPNADVVGLYYSFLTDSRESSQS